MANIYVRSTDGSNSDNGSTWALAKLDIAGATAIDAAGDYIYLSDAHAESSAADVTWTFAGTKASPVRVICGDDAAEPPTTYSTAATATTTTGSFSINNLGNYAEFYGLSIIAGSGQSTTRNIAVGASTAVTSFTDCALRLASTGTGSLINLAANSNNQTNLINTTVRFAASAQSITMPSTSSILDWIGGGIASGGTSPSTLFTTLSSGNRLQISGADFVQGSSSMNLFNSTSANIRAVVRNCKLPASWSGSLHSGTPGGGSRYSLYNCDSTDTNYRLAIAAHYGTIISETTIVRTGGANDGTTGLSWKLVSNSDAEYPLSTLDSDEIVQWNDTTGSSKTCTVEIITDNVTLTNAECWLEVQYLGTSGFPLGVVITDAKADVLATAANQDTSSVTWTTTGLGTPVKQYLQVTFTPQEKGFVHAVVKLAKASTTVYVDPLLTIA